MVVIDETTLEPVARSLPTLRALPPGDATLLPGKIAGVFDVRRQAFVEIQIVDSPHQNEKVLARDLVATLAPGTLVLADLGYFGFQWFDDLTDAGQWWVSRLGRKRAIASSMSTTNPRPSSMASSGSAPIARTAPSMPCASSASARTAASTVS